MRCSGTIQPLGILYVDQSDEKTEEQVVKARAYKEYLEKIDYYRQGGCVLMVALDEAKWQLLLDSEAKEEEDVQNAWWQD